MIYTILWPLRMANAWLSEPTPNASGRLGLFRILYAIFYLWYLATQHPVKITSLPRSYFYNRILILKGWPIPPSYMLINIVESILAALLVLLVFGYKTRIVTLLVIILGVILEGYFTMVDPEQGNILLVFFIPCFMLLAGRWGDAHSVDRFVCIQSGGQAVDTHAPNASFLASRLLLVMISGQFVLSGMYKLTGTWISHPDLLGNLMLSTSVDAAYFGIYINPAAKIIADTPILHIGLQWTAIVFECLFFICVFGRIPRVLVLTAALVFHSLNAHLMWVTFTTIMIVYAAFMDWQSLYDRLGMNRLADRIIDIPIRVVIPIVAACAMFTGLTWNTLPTARAIMTLGGLVDFQTIWIPVPFIAIYWLGSVLFQKHERRAW